jgi:hypothetical protein
LSPVLRGELSYSTRVQEYFRVNGKVSLHRKKGTTMTMLLPLPFSLIKEA